MKVAVKLLNDLRVVGGVAYLANEDTVRVKPASVVPPELKARLIKYRKKVLAFLLAPAPKDKVARAVWDLAFLATAAHAFEGDGVASVSRGEGEWRWKAGKGVTTPGVKTPYRGPWPDSLEGLGEAHVDSLTVCLDCLDEATQGKEMVLKTPTGAWLTVNRPEPTTTWTRYGSRALCLTHACRRQRMAR